MKLKALTVFIGSSICFTVFSSGTFTIGEVEPVSNTVPIVFSSGDGKFSDGSTKKVYEVRKGIKWNQLKEGFEKPRQTDIVPPTSTVFFSNTWLDETKTAMKANYIIEKSITVTADYGAESFATASWETIANFFNGKGNTKGNVTYKGTEGLANYFGYSYKNHSCPELIGQERYLTYAGEPRRVVVIGFNCDRLDTADGWGAITFQFVDTITDAPFNYKETNSYIGSHLENYLNTSVYNNIQFDNNAEIKKQIQPARKWTYTNGGVVTDKEEKVFALSLKEMNVKKPLQGETKLEGLSNDALDKNSVNYPFYAKNTDGNYAFRQKTGEGRYGADPVLKTDVNGNPSSYWLRSSDNVNDTAYNKNHSYITDTNGVVGDVQKVNYTCGVAPAFCFGKSKIKKETFTKCSWDLITSFIDDANNRKDSPSSGLDDLKDAFSDDDDNVEYPNTFIGLERKINIDGNEYQVRVIGEEQDYLSNPINGVTKAALTFEITSVICTSDYTVRTTRFDDDYGALHPYWWKTRTFYAEKNWVEDNGWDFLFVHYPSIREDCPRSSRLKQWTDNIYNTITVLDKSKIKSVNKSFAVCYVDTSWYSRSTSFKTFPLSYLEIGGLTTSYVESDYWYGPMSACLTLDGKYDFTYKYYKGTGTKSVKRIKKSIGPSSSSQIYRLRTSIELASFLGEYLFKGTCIVDKNGGFNSNTDRTSSYPVEYYDYNHEAAFSGAFCI